MVGVQGSGKSHFAETNFGKAGYVIVSNDKTGGKDKSLNLMKKCLGNYLIDIYIINRRSQQFVLPSFA